MAKKRSPSDSTSKIEENSPSFISVKCHFCSEKGKRIFLKKGRIQTFFGPKRPIMLFTSYTNLSGRTNFGLDFPLRRADLMPDSQKDYRDYIPLNFWTQDYDCWKCTMSFTTFSLHNAQYIFDKI